MKHLFRNAFKKYVEETYLRKIFSNVFHWYRRYILGKYSISDIYQGNKCLYTFACLSSLKHKQVHMPKYRHLSSSVLCATVDTLIRT